MFANGLQPWHIIVLVIVLIVLFGAKKLPGAARGIGQSMRIFRAEAKQMRDGEPKGDAEAGSEDESAAGQGHDGAPSEGQRELASTTEDPVKRQLQAAKRASRQPHAASGQAETPAEPRA